MSDRLLTQANRFLERKIDAEAFVEEFVAQWKRERDDGTLLSDTSKLSEVLSSIFCFADLYNPDDEREDFEFDEARLRLEIERTLNRIGKQGNAREKLW